MTTAVMMRKDSLREYLGQISMPLMVPSTQSILLHIGPGHVCLESGSGATHAMIHDVCRLSGGGGDGPM